MATATTTDHSVLYTFRLEESKVAKLNTLATKKGVTHAELARQAIDAFLKGKR